MSLETGLSTHMSKRALRRYMTNTREYRCAKYLMLAHQTYILRCYHFGMDGNHSCWFLAVSRTSHKGQRRLSHQKCE